MCIICDKPAGVDMPTDEGIKHMFEKNPHGAGFAIQGWFEKDARDPKTGKQVKRRRFEVHYQKGFMTVDDLIEALGPKEKLKDYRVVMHCRITTSGNSDRPTTHPFLLSNNYGDLRKTEGEGAVLFHNGVFTGLGGVIDKKSSDTQDFTIGIANRMLNKPGHISAISKKIAETIAGSCRVLILYPDPKHPDFRLGTWHDHDGCKYSNTGYKSNIAYGDSRYESTSTGTKSYCGRHDSIYDDDFYEDYYRGYYGLDNPIDDDDIDDYFNKKKDASHDYDEWGCNHAPYALPSYDTDWIQCKDKERMKIIERTAVSKRYGEDGTERFFFRYDSKKPWILDYKTLQAYNQKGYYKLKEKLEYEDEELAQLWEDNVKFFSEPEELEAFLDEAKKISKNLYYYESEYWYVDNRDYIAYTEEGLKLMFSSGEVGHVKSAILKDGYDSYNEKRKAIKSTAEGVSAKDMKQAFKLLSDGKEK